MHFFFIKHIYFLMPMDMLFNDFFYAIKAFNFHKIYLMEFNAF